ncbi:GGDEF domain-containing protein [Aliidiomarina haloalkalitolerans]|uniref:diguanylate cyclase n=1 Tax=Aliidiomarina haloalkalitolerans TaxID=859059 RepID=A0A432VRF8_9GAMM|nr:GGDEF domain-containing protein [Aliidiomarina haloalkalitolerans]RUO18873.1 GGDEF domain-containing protein [Aliidiomarina haloalkalitolerans]
MPTNQYPYSERRSPISRRLSTRLLLRIGLWSLIVVAMVAAAGFYIAYHQAKKNQKQELLTQINNQVQYESRTLRDAVASAEILRDSFLQRYQQYADFSELATKFDQRHEETEPGTWRLKPEFYHGTLVEPEFYQHISTFIGPGERPLSDELKARIIISQQVLNERAPAWDRRWANSHFSMPENVLVQYSSEHPWGLLAAHDLVMTDYSVVRSTLQQFNPQRRPLWTGLYYDLSADYWTITYQLPVDLNGRHLVNASHDIPLKQLVSGLVRSNHDQIQHFVFGESGQLIASAESLSADYQQAGILDIHKLTNPQYKQIFAQLEPAFVQQRRVVLPNAIPGQLLIAQPLEVADWWYVTLYPYAEIQRAALTTPLAISLSAIVLLLAILGIVSVFVNRFVADPLQRLAHLAELIGNKQYDAVIRSPLLSEDIRSEVGQLIRSFRAMAQRLLENQNNLEKLVDDRTKELERANRRLAQVNQKLDQMAHFDGLTNLWNRRAFDRDLRMELQSENSGHLALALGDLDKFKAFNDRYGHIAGDDVLQRVAKALEATSYGRVYRYGGEEIAVLIPADNHAEAQLQAEALCQAVRNLAIEHQDAERGVLTISFGVVQLDPNQDANDNITRADELLYQAKKNGGDGCLVAGEPL